MKLLKSIVTHKRDKPAKNAFSYNVFYISFALENESDIPKLFSFDQFNIFSIYKKDYGAHENFTSLFEWAKKKFEEHDVVFTSDMTIELITHPRLFGYAFNPISFWMLRNDSKTLQAVLCEVHNTFGQRHNYILKNSDLRPISSDDTFYAKKNLYVSPYNSMEGHYTFNFLVNEERFTSKINYYKNEEKVLSTVMSGTFEKLTNFSILKAMAFYPFMTFMIVFRIHWQAVKLYVKKVPHTLKKRPKKVAKEETVGHDLKNKSGDNE